MISHWGILIDNLDAGKGYKEQVKKLKQAAETHGWQRELGQWSQVICLRKEWKPFDDEEDLMVRHQWALAATLITLPPLRGE